MKTVLLLLVYFSSLVFAQNWMPMEVGNKWQYLLNRKIRGPGLPFYFYNSIEELLCNKDSIVNGKKYYSFFSNGRNLFFLSKRGFYRYDSIANKIYLLINDSDKIIMDFNLNNGDTIWQYYYNNYYAKSVIKTGLFAINGINYNYKGFINIQGYITRPILKFVQNFGVVFDSSYYGLIGEQYDGFNFIQGNIFSNGNFYFTQNSFIPSIIFNPLTYKNTQQITLYPSVNHNFKTEYIDTVTIQSFYKKINDSINLNIVGAKRLNLTDTFSCSINIDTSLLKNSYRFYYRIYARDKSYTPHEVYSPVDGYYSFNWDSTTNINKNEILPNEYKLEQNYPNPFNPKSNIKYQIFKKGFVTLKVFDILGREIAILVDEFKEAGNYEVEFNVEANLPDSRAGLRFALASGVYFYRLVVTDISNHNIIFAQTKKMILEK